MILEVCEGEVPSLDSPARNKPKDKEWTLVKRADVPPRPGQRPKPGAANSSQEEEETWKELTE